MEKKSERFNLVMSKVGREALRKLARCEGVSESEVVRRLVWCEAERRGLLGGLRGGEQNNER